MYLTLLNDNNISSQRQRLVNCLHAMLASVDGYFTQGDSGITLGNTSAHYGQEIARMEGLSRMLWALFPLLAAGDSSPFTAKYISAICHGTDPEHPGYWGVPRAYDQRLVEMAVYGVGMALMKTAFTDWFTPQQQRNIFNWLNHISDAEMPDNNWNYFAIMVQLGFKQAGMPWDAGVISARFEKMEAYYLGDGWYSDGPGRPKDYYISMAFHYYGLIYATGMNDDDPLRCSELRARAERFSQDFIHLFAADGSAVPFGRSLTYRFAEAAFWSAAAFAGLQSYSQGEMKGLILRHLRWWLAQPICDRDGILTIGYAYPNLVMAEDYNSPGSPYWAFKLFLVLALDEQHPFWQAQECPLPTLRSPHAICPADQLLVRDATGQHVYLLTAGQLELNNYVNTAAKYTKFAYSNRFGFTLERGRYGIKHAACDSMLMLAEGDEHYRGRRDCRDVVTSAQAVFSRWSPWHDVDISSWLIPCGEWHVRVHHIRTARRLDSVEGGFAVMNTLTTLTDASDRGCVIQAVNGSSAIVSLHDGRRPDSVITPPNSSIMFAECAAIPVLSGSLAPGEHWLCSAVAACGPQQRLTTELPTLDRDKQRFIIHHRGQQTIITID